MLRCLFGFRGHDAAEVNDALNTCFMGSCSNVRRRPAVRVTEVTARSNRVDEVEDDINAGNRTGQRRAIEHVSLDDRCLRTPRNSRKLGWVAGQASDVVASLDQHGSKPSTDVTARSRDQNSLAHQKDRRHILRILRSSSVSLECAVAPSPAGVRNSLSNPVGCESCACSLPTSPDGLSSASVRPC